MSKEPICAIVNRVCPENSDPAGTDKKGKHTYCPHWVEHIMETNTDQSGRFVDQIYRGCFLARLPQYMVSIAAGAGHAAASYDKANNALHKIEKPAAVQALVAMGVAAYAGGLIKQGDKNHQQPKEIDRCVES